MIIVLRFLVLIEDNHSDRRTGSDTFKYPAQDLYPVFLFSLGHNSGLSGAAPIKIPLDILFTDLNARRTTVNNDTETFAMGFSECSDGKNSTEGVACHIRWLIGSKIGNILLD